MIQITYQKRNGEIFNRIRNTYFEHRVGDTTSMGWKVLDIKYNYKGKFYDQYDYDKLVNLNWNKEKKLFKIKKNFKYLYSNLTYFLSVLILLRILENVIIFSR